MPRTTREDVSELRELRHELGNALAVAAAHSTRSCRSPRPTPRKPI
jgi:hypothetical protein